MKKHLLCICSLLAPSILPGCFTARVVPILESHYPDPAEKPTAFDVILQKVDASNLFQIEKVRAVVEINGQTYPMRRLGESVFSTYRYMNPGGEAPHDGEYRIRYSFHLTPYGSAAGATEVQQYVINYPPGGSIVRPVGNLRWSCGSTIRYSESIASTSVGRIVVFDYVFEGADPLGPQDRFENVTIENHGTEPVILTEPSFKTLGRVGEGEGFSIVANHFPKKVPAGQSYTFPVRYRRDMNNAPGTYRSTGAMTIRFRKPGSDKKFKFGPIALDATFHRLH